MVTNLSRFHSTARGVKFFGNAPLRFTVPRTDNAYVFPASHVAGSNNAALPRMGERFRLKQSFDISGFSAANQVILQALKDYGMIVADNGSSWFLGGTPSSRWSDDDLRTRPRRLACCRPGVHRAGHATPRRCAGGRRACHPRRVRQLGSGEPELP